MKTKILTLLLSLGCSLSASAWKVNIGTSTGETELTDHQLLNYSETYNLQFIREDADPYFYNYGVRYVLSGGDSHFSLTNYPSFYASITSRANPEVEGYSPTCTLSIYGRTTYDGEFNVLIGEPITIVAATADGYLGLSKYAKYDGGGMMYHYKALWTDDARCSRRPWQL